MTCTIPQNRIDETIAFHGHSCPGLAIGIRVAEYAQTQFPEVIPGGLVCVTETDMCGVDGIQYLTGCTFGKGNLIHRDFGKSAFSFYDRNSGRGIRLVLRTDVRGKEHNELSELMGKGQGGQLTEQQRARLAELRADYQARLMSLPLTELFTLEELKSSPPRGARVLQGLACESCGEQTMESRTRRYSGQTLCIPCFEKVEQKI